MKKREAITEIANRSQIKRELAIDVFNSTLDTFICALPIPALRDALNEKK